MCKLCNSCTYSIVNHNYKNEQEIINKLNLVKISGLNNIEKKNYIYYKNPQGIDYITYDFEPISQIMRIFIAKDYLYERKA